MVIVLCSIVFAVLAGPFGTLTHLTTTERVVLWVPLITGSVVFGWIAMLSAEAMVKGRKAILVDALTVFFMTLMYAPCVWLYTLWVAPNSAEWTGGLPQIALSLCIVMMAFVAIRHAVIAWRRDAEEVHSDATADPRIYQRLPASLRAPVLRLSAKDHRVEVVTTAGTAELRLRLGDAVAEMEPIEGFMAHRSHWVAKSAVTEAQRRGSDKLYLKLSNGDLVPVSRTFRQDWMETGLLEPFENASDGDATSPAASARHAAPGPSEQRSFPRA